LRIQWLKDLELWSIEPPRFQLDRRLVVRPGQGFARTARRLRHFAQVAEPLEGIHADASKLLDLLAPDARDETEMVVVAPDLVTKLPPGTDLAVHDRLRVNIRIASQRLLEPAFHEPVIGAIVGKPVW